MKQETNIPEKYKEEIQDTQYTMKKIKHQLEEFKNKHPKVGYMLCFGILDGDQHWVCSSFDIIPLLAFNICSDVAEQIVIKATANETKNS